MYIYIHIHTCICMYMYICIYIFLYYIYIFRKIYIHMYIHIHKYIHTHIYAYTYNRSHVIRAESSVTSTRSAPISNGSSPAIAGVRPPNTIGHGSSRTWTLTARLGELPTCVETACGKKASNAEGESYECMHACICASIHQVYMYASD